MENRMGFFEFVKTIKKKVHDRWVSYDRKLWTARIFVYIGLFLLVIFVGTILFTHFNLFHTDADSARYMLSALVQSQAAIVAIVITLTLIAVQLTASAYSPRVIDIFKKNPDMWILFGCYGVSMFYGFLVLKLVEGAEGGAVSQSAIWTLGWVYISFESCVSMAYWLGAFTFVALFPYMWNIISLLKSENIIKRLAVEITKDKSINSKEDPIQPIVDIIHGSIMKYDLETTRKGLKEVTELVTKIINSKREEEISNRFYDHLFRINRLAISREDEHSTIEVIKNLANFEKSASERGFEYATIRAVVYLGDVGKEAAEKGLESATGLASLSLRDVGITAAKKGFEHATRDVATNLGDIGKKAVKQGLEQARFTAGMYLRDVGKEAAKKGFEDATREAVMYLGDVGAAGALIEVGTIAVDKGLEDAAKRATEVLAELTISNEALVKTAIRNYKSKIEEQDRDSFQKFMKIYEQELEKLRAEKRTANIS